MVINFNKKRRQITLVLLAILCLIVIPLVVNHNKEEETIQVVDDKQINNYIIDVIFNDKDKIIECNHNITYVNNTGRTLDKLYMHIYPNAFLDSKICPFEKEEMDQAYPNGFNKGYIDILNILNGDSKLKYNIEGDKNDILEVELDKKLQKGEKYSIDIKYKVKLPNCLGRFGYGEDTINITNWFPIACVYDEKGWNLESYSAIGDPFYSDTSNFTVNILVPSKYEIASTGSIIEEKKDKYRNKKLYKLQAKKVRDFAMILSDKFIINKSVYGKTSIITYSLNKDLAVETNKIAKESIRVFSELFAEYPYDIYSVVASDFFIGGMEYPTLVMIDKTLYNKNSKFLLEYVIAHETAHQWWYSIVGNNEVSEPWLDEALTEYSTILYFENKYGKEVSDKLLQTMEVQSENYRGEDMFKSTNEFNCSSEYSINVYTKGALIFNEIRKEVGDKIFFETLQEYCESYKFQNVNGTQFMKLWKDKGVDINKIVDKCS
ncbi:M1 family metallopeptidase [Intestinibacter sp.]